VKGVTKNSNRRNWDSKILKTSQRKLSASCKSTKDKLRPKTLKRRVIGGEKEKKRVKQGQPRRVGEKTEALHLPKRRVPQRAKGIHTRWATLRTEIRDLIQMKKGGQPQHRWRTQKGPKKCTGERSRGRTKKKKKG